MDASRSATIYTRDDTSAQQFLLLYKYMLYIYVMYYMLYEIKTAHL